MLEITGFRIPFKSSWHQNSKCIQSILFFSIIHECENLYYGKHHENTPTAEEISMKFVSYSLKKTNRLSAAILEENYHQLRFFKSEN